jgi:hypothetical protein
MPLARVEQGADEVALVDERQQGLGLGDVLRKSRRSGVPASSNPPVRWTPQDWPEISSISRYRRIV